MEKEKIWLGRKQFVLTVFSIPFGWVEKIAVFILFSSRNVLSLSRRKDRCVRRYALVVSFAERNLKIYN